MLKINLLPAYVIERRKVRVYSMIAAVALVAEIAVLGFIYNKQRVLAAALDEAKTAKSNEKSQVDKLQQDAQAEKAKNQPFQNVIDFIRKVKDSPRKQGQLLSELRKYIYWRVLVTEIDISDGQNVKLSCATDSVDSYARFVSNFMECPLFDQPPIFSGIGGGSGGGGMIGGGMPGMPTGMGMPGMSGMPGMEMGMRGGMAGGGAGSESSTDPLPIKFTVMAHLAPPYQTTGIPMPSGDVTVTGGGGGGGGMGGPMDMMMGGGMSMGGGAMSGMSAGMSAASGS